MNDRYKLLATKDLYPEFFWFTKYGFLGVHLFFMISGFVILASALNRSAIEFAIARWTRLYPSYWFAVIFTTGVLFIFLGQDFDVTLTDFLANMTLLNDYMGITDIDPVYWTLHAELQFYGCVFLLILFGVVQHYRIWLVIWIALAIIYATFRQPFFMPWFISPAYSSYFIAGAVFYLAAQDGYGRFHIAMLFISLALSLYYVFPQTDEYIQLHTLGDQVITSTVIIAYYLLFFLISSGRLSIKRSATVLLLGSLTYPLYLTHHVAGRYLIDYLDPMMNKYVILFGLISAALFIAYVVTELIDKRLAGFLRKTLTRLLVRDRTTAAHISEIRPE